MNGDVSQATAQASAGHLQSVPEPGTVGVQRRSREGSPQPDAAQRQIDCCTRRIGRIARRARRKANRVRTGYVRARETLTTADARNPVGGSFTGLLAIEATDYLRELVRDATLLGHRHHERQSWFVRVVPAMVVACDAAILLYFMAGVLNVDWASPVGVPILVALAFALFGTGVSYAAFSGTGSRLRDRKDDRNEIHWSTLDTTTVAACCLSIGTALALSALMFVRLDAEIVDALGNRAGILPVAFAAVFAVLSFSANLLIVGVHALDGSYQTAHLDRLGRTVSTLSRRYARRLRRVSALASKADALAQRAIQIGSSAVTGATTRLATASPTTDEARGVDQAGVDESMSALQGNAVPGVNGSRQSTPVSTVDLTALNAVTAEMHRLRTDMQRFVDPGLRSLGDVWPPSGLGADPPGDERAA